MGGVVVVSPTTRLFLLVIDVDKHAYGSSPRSAPSAWRGAPTGRWRPLPFFRFDNGDLKLPLGVERHGTDGRPVARLTAPTGGVGLPGRLIDGMALGQHLGILPSMPLCRCHQADPAVAMLVVVPLHEAGHPLAGVVDASEPINGVARAVLAGAKQRLRVGVIIGDPRPTERWRDAQLMQLLQQWIKNERKRLSLTAHPPGKMLTILVSVGPNDMLN